MRQQKDLNRNQNNQKAATKNNSKLNKRPGNIESRKQKPGEKIITLRLKKNNKKTKLIVHEIIETHTEEI